MRPRLTRGMAIVLALLSILPFVTGLTGDFTYDDKVIIRDNARLTSPLKVPEIFTTGYFGGPPSSGTAYRPVVLLSYALQVWVHGARAVPFHVVNVLLHAAVTLLFASWLLAIGFPRGAVTATSALFSVATIHVEAVTGLVGRAELLAAILVLVTARLWLRATDGETIRKGPLAAAALAFLAGVFVKENAVIAPGVVLLGELFENGSGADPLGRLKRLFQKKGAAFALLSLPPLVVLFTVRRLLLKGFLAASGIFDLENPLVPLPPLLRLGNAASLLFRYVAKTFVPVGLSADHSAYALPMASSFREPRAFLGLLGLGALAFLVGRVWASRPLVAFGAAFFFGTFLPTANLLFPIGTIYAERLVYLPSAGLFAMAVGLAMPRKREVPAPAPVPWREALLVAAVVAYAGATLVRNRAFRDDRTLYADMLVKVPNSAKAHYDFAFDASRRGLPAEAAPHFRRAAEIFPRYYDAWASLGKIAWDEKRWDEAIQDYKKSVEILPRYENGRWGLAKTLEESGRLVEAEKAYRDGIAEFPESYPLLFHFAGFLTNQGRLDEAEDAWIDAIGVADGANAHLSYARLLVRMNAEEAAWEEARLALVADPRFVEARLFLAERYALAGKTLGAAMELSRAWRTFPGDAAAAARFLDFTAAHPETRGRADAWLPRIVALFTARPKDEGLRRAMEKVGGKA